MGLRSPCQRAFFLAAAVAAAVVVPGAAVAQTINVAPPSNVITLAATANLEVPQDWFGIVFATAREGADANAVQAQLKAALDTALNEARRAAKPGQIEVRTGNFGLHPRYDNKGQPSGWTGTAELVVEGRDVGGISQLAGRIQTMTVARVAFSLSREAREKVEGEVTAQAIGRFRAKAEQVARAFGFAGYTLREVQVSSADTMPPPPVPRLQAARMSAEAALPVEAGKASVTITVSGSVQLAVR